MKMWALVVLGAGIVILLAGNAISNVGASVDRLVSSKWSGIALLILGAVLFIGSDSSVRLKLERSL